MGLIILYHSEIIFPPRQTTKSNLPQHKYWLLATQYYSERITSIYMNLDRTKLLSILEINFLRKIYEFPT